MWMWILNFLLLALAITVSGCKPEPEPENKCKEERNVDHDGWPVLIKKLLQDYKRPKSASSCNVTQATGTVSISDQILDNIIILMLISRVLVLSHQAVLVLVVPRFVLLSFPATDGSGSQCAVPHTSSVQCKQLAEEWRSAFP